MKFTQVYGHSQLWKKRMQKIDIDNLILFFLFTGIISLFSEFLMTPRTISAISLYFLFLVRVLFFRYNPFKNIDMSLLFLLFLFFLSLFISAVLSSDLFYSFRWIKKSYWVPLALGMGILSLEDRSNLYKVIFMSFILAFFLNNVHFYFKAVSHSGTHFPFSPVFIVDRNYSFILPFMISFSLGGLVFFRSMFLRMFIFFNIVCGTFFMILTGARGGYFSLFLIYFFWTFYFFLMFLRTKKLLNPKILVICVFLIFSLLSLIAMAASFHPKVQAALKRGFSPNGRDVIIKTRFPIIFKEHPVFGLGYGRRLYFDFLDKHKVPKIHGHFDKNEKRFVYHSDEGIFIQTIIRQGLVGFIVFLGLLICSLKQSFYYSLPKNNLEVLSLVAFSIFSTLVSCVCFRGLVETIKLTEFVLLVFLLLGMSKDENSNDFSRKIAA